MEFINPQKDNIRQRKSEERKSEGYSPDSMTADDFLQDSSLFNYSSVLDNPTVQKKAGTEEEEELQMKENPAQKQALPQEEELQMKKNPVQKKSTNSSNSMPEEVQAKMESSLGADFSDVKIHSNDSSATEMGALAYAQGNDIHFAPGQYNPNTSSGQELLGHELTHVVQQRQGRVQATTQQKGISVNDDPSLEKEADDMGKKAAQGETSSISNEQKQHSQTLVQQKKIVQKNPIAALGAAEWIAAGALGYQVTQDAVGSTSGDVTYTFDEMEGVKFPNDDSEFKSKHKYPITRGHKDITVWRGTESFKKIGLKFRVTYEHDGYSIGSISMRPLDIYDWPLWGGSVNVNITPQRALRGESSTVRLTVNVNTTRSLIGGDVDSGIFTLDGTGYCTADESTSYLWYEIS